jgi:hypothetical protein
VTDPIAYCTICGKGLHAGDLMCNHTDLETARYKRDGCACGGEHVGEVTLTTTDAGTCSGDNEGASA